MEKPRAARVDSRVWLAPVVALAVGLPILIAGELAQSAPVLAWFVPVCDVLAVGAMVVAAILAALDAQLRRDRRSLPVVAIAVCTAVMWAGHFVLFPGDIPGVTGARLNQATSTLFLTINVATPVMLSIALLQGSRRLDRPLRANLVSAAIGATLGLLAIAAAIAIGDGLATVAADGSFSRADTSVGVAGLFPAIAGIAAFVLGRRGDERIAGGVLAALTFTALNSVSLIGLTARFTPAWYADHVLAALPFVALLVGQLWLYSGSVIAEQRASALVAAAAERRRIGLDIARAMAVEVDPLPVVQRLLAGVTDAVDADRGTMLRLVPGAFVVENSIDRAGVPAEVGQTFALDSVIADGRPVVADAVASREPRLIGPYHVEGVDGRDDAHAGVRHALVLPLVRGGEVDAVLILGRRSDRPFAETDVERLHELAAIAALLIRNVRLLADAESASLAKSSFMNLAAHELRTPLSVISGYAEMLADGTFGPVGNGQERPIETIRNKVRELAQHVEHLLIASRLEGATAPGGDSGAIADLGAIARQAVDRARGRAELLQADLRVDAPSRAVRVAGDERDLAIVIDNLLNNAMTYSPPPARVTVQVEDGERPVIRVIDRGIGIPPAEQERIFEQFHRVDDPAFGYPSGTGLGLYIGRRLAQRHGGELVLERSTPGEGSTFALRLPRVDGSAGRAEIPEQLKDHLGSSVIEVE